MSIYLANPRTGINYEVEDIDVVSEDRVRVDLRNKVLTKGKVIDANADLIVWKSPDWYEKE